PGGEFEQVGAHGGGAVVKQWFRVAGEVVARLGAVGGAAQPFGEDAAVVGAGQSGGGGGGCVGLQAAPAGGGGRGGCCRDWLGCACGLCGLGGHVPVLSSGGQEVVCVVIP